MKKITYINAEDNWAQYAKAREFIVDTYNDSSDMHVEIPQLNPADLLDKSCLHYFGIEGVLGGILVEQLLGNEKQAVITFAGIDKKDRNKGYCKRLVKKATSTLAKAGVTLIGVQINEFDDHEIWKRQGFNQVVAFGNGIALVKG